MEHTTDNDVLLLKTLAEYNQKNLLNKNLEGISAEEAMVFPDGEINCLNWILGHLIFVRNSMIEVLGGKPVWQEGDYEFYKRGAKPLEHTAEFLPYETLKTALHQSYEALIAALDNKQKLETRLIKNNEMDLAGLMMHEIYHSGQISYLRRILGKKGAI